MNIWKATGFGPLPLDLSMPSFLIGRPPMGGNPIIMAANIVSSFLRRGRLTTANGMITTVALATCTFVNIDTCKTNICIILQSV